MHGTVRCRVVRLQIRLQTLSTSPCPLTQPCAVTIGTFSTAASIALGTFPPAWLTRPYLRVFADLRPLAVEGAVPTTAVFAEVDVTFGDDISGVGGSAGIRLGW